MNPTLETEPSCSDRSVRVCVCLWVCADAVSLLDLLTLFGAFLYFFECAYVDLPTVYWRHSKGPQQPEIEKKNLNFYPGSYIFCAAHRALGAWSSRKRSCLAVETALGIYLLEAVFCAHFRPLNFNMVVELVLANESDQVMSIKMWFVKPVITWLQRTKLKTLLCFSFLFLHGLLRHGRGCLHTWP